MAKTAAVVGQEQPPAEFPVNLSEYLAELGKKNIESTKAFANLMKTQKDMVPRTRAEWAKLLELFKKKPTAIPWPRWVAQNLKKEGGN